MSTEQKNLMYLFPCYKPRTTCCYMLKISFFFLTFLLFYPTFNTCREWESPLGGEKEQTTQKSTAKEKKKRKVQIKCKKKRKGLIF